MHICFPFLPFSFSLHVCILISFHFFFPTLAYAFPMDDQADKPPGFQDNARCTRIYQLPPFLLFPIFLSFILSSSSLPSPSSFFSLLFPHTHSFVSATDDHAYAEIHWNLPPEFVVREMSLLLSYLRSLSLALSLPFSVFLPFLSFFFHFPNSPLPISFPISGSFSSRWTQCFRHGHPSVEPRGQLFGLRVPLKYVLMILRIIIFFVFGCGPPLYGLC